MVSYSACDGSGALINYRPLSQPAADSPTRRAHCACICSRSRTLSNSFPSDNSRPKISCTRRLSIREPGPAISVRQNHFLILFKICPKPFEDIHYQGIRVKGISSVTFSSSPVLALSTKVSTQSSILFLAP